MVATVLLDGPAEGPGGSTTWRTSRTGSLAPSRTSRRHAGGRRSPLGRGRPGRRRGPGSGGPSGRRAAGWRPPSPFWPRRHRGRRAWPARPAGRSRHGEAVEVTAATVRDCPCCSTPFCSLSPLPPGLPGFSCRPLHVCVSTSCMFNRTGRRRIPCSLLLSCADFLSGDVPGADVTTLRPNFCPDYYLPVPRLHVAPRHDVLGHELVRKEPGSMSGTGAPAHGARPTRRDRPGRRAASTPGAPTSPSSRRGRPRPRPSPRCSPATTSPKVLTSPLRPGLGHRRFGGLRRAGRCVRTNCWSGTTATPRADHRRRARRAAGWTLFGDGSPAARPRPNVGRRADRVHRRGARGVRRHAVLRARPPAARPRRALGGLPPAGGGSSSSTPRRSAVLGWEREVRVVAQWNGRDLPGR